MRHTLEPASLPVVCRQLNSLVEQMFYDVVRTLRLMKARVASATAVILEMCFCHVSLEPS